MSGVYQYDDERFGRAYYDRRGPCCQQWLQSVTAPIRHMLYVTQLSYHPNSARVFQTLSGLRQLAWQGVCTRAGFAPSTIKMLSKSPLIPPVSQ